VNRFIRIVSMLSLSTYLAASPDAVQAQTHRPERGTTTPTAKGQPSAAAAVGESTPAARVIQYGGQDVVKINTKIRYTSLIVLPKGEQILDFTCGDKEFWVVNGTQNFAYIKPAKAAAQTNLNLVTAAGNIYSFVLTEVSEKAGVEPDLKIFIEPKDESIVAAAGSSPRFVSAQQLEDYRQQIELAKEETRQAKAASEKAADARVTKFISNVRFPFRFESGKKPFYVRAMYTDDAFTYIQARPEETPALYEIKDGKPNLVNFDYKDGVYVVNKILDRGYLAIGKKKLAFSRED
jgi:type IV secretory pathway VirB9-like protein